MSGLAARDLACVRGGRLLFEGLSFTVPVGGALRVTGPNGAGKSSLIRLLAGLLAPAGGATDWGGDGIALMAEAHALDRERALGEALTFWARMDGRADVDARVAEALAAVDLAHLADVPVAILSTGQRRRAAFARVVASGAGLWLLDEPTSGVDDAAVARMEVAIARHRAGGGVVVAATHQPLALPDAVEVVLT